MPKGMISGASTWILEESNRVNNRKNNASPSLHFSFRKTTKIQEQAAHIQQRPIPMASPILQQSCGLNQSSHWMQEI
jgi:hypothetical protein